MAKTTSKKTTKGKATNSSKREAKKPARAVKPSAKAGKPAKSIKKTAPRAKAAAAAPPTRKAQKPGRVVPNIDPVSRKGLPAAALPQNFKPGKNQAGLGKKDLEFFRDLLIAKRRELLGDVQSMEQEALRAGGGSNLSNLPLHMADMGTDNYEQEFTLGLVEKDRQLLREINLAVAKIADGRYGICEGTGKPIARARLEAQPWAKYSIEHARQMEKGYPMYRGAI